MVQRNKLQYASKIYDLGLLQIILNAEAVPGCSELISRALNMSAQINDALLGKKDRFQASQDVPLLWSHFRRLLESIRQRALQTLGSNECRQQYNSSLLELLRNVWQSCLELLGTPPCSFSVFAMGSLSRLEAAAFSDVEYGMVVENVKFEDHQCASETTPALASAAHSKLFFLGVVCLGSSRPCVICLNLRLDVLEKDLVFTLTIKDHRPRIPR